MTDLDSHLQAIRMAKAHGGALFRYGKVWTFKDCPLQPGIMASWARTNGRLNRKPSPNWWAAESSAGCRPGKSA